MAIADIPMFAMLRTKLQWNQERQRLLSENVANAETPDFKPSDLAPLNFDAQPSGVTPVALWRTSPNHVAGTEAAPSFKLQGSRDFEVVPTGNAVNVEDEMLKVAANQMDFQAATALYTHGLGLIKTAIGK